MYHIEIEFFVKYDLKTILPMKKPEKLNMMSKPLFAQLSLAQSCATNSSMTSQSTEIISTCTILMKPNSDNSEYSIK
tara:strand:+ start:325 stop:555 length:231 start_codon:yes stop_codon:yes gene_type:complete